MYSENQILSAVAKTIDLERQRTSSPALRPLTSTEMSKDSFNERKQKIREIYRYDEMSNKVLKADKRMASDKTNPAIDAAISQPKSMLGRISVKDMGTSSNTGPTEEEKQIAIKNMEVDNVKLKSSTSKRNITQNSTVLDGTTDKLDYYPMDDFNTVIYEKIVQHLSILLGDDMPHDVITSATDILLHILKDDETESDSNWDTKKIKIERELGVKIENQVFNEIVNLSKQINDYHNKSEIDTKDNFEEIPLVVDGSDNEENVQQNALTDEIEQEDVNEESTDSSRPRNELTELANEIPEKDDIFVLAHKNKAENYQFVETPIYEVDEFYLERLLSSKLTEMDPSDVHVLADKIFSILSEDMHPAYWENEIAKHVDLKYYSLIKNLVRNRDSIYWGIRLSTSPPIERNNILESIRNLDLGFLADQYLARKVSSKRKQEDIENDQYTDSSETKKPREEEECYKPKIVDLKNLIFDQGSELMTTTKITLPGNSYKRVKKNYEEIHIPPLTKPADDFRLIPISELPQWAHNAFPSNEANTLNRVQSEVFPSAFKSDENMLICAPTGAGKTNIAMLAVLRSMSHCRVDSTESFNFKNLKIIYIAPLKALVQEQVREFRRRLTSFGIKVAELTGDSNLTKKQIAETHILVSTPEKWDVITRKTYDTNFTNLVSLIVIDEVHLLHDERGPVLESIVARTIRQKNLNTSVRLVALSATLPNYEDVGRFLRVQKDHVFYFDSSFRPCPLAQQFCGVTERNGIKKINAMNEVCYDKILDAANEGHQVIIFVHSRKDTARTAKWLKEKLIADDKAALLVKSEPGSREILRRESENIDDHWLKDLINSGLGIHHAGLSRGDRSLSEDLFADGLIQVLVSTSTLAWGVNLPAHTVIIKGTEVYSPEKGSWTQLSAQDVLQMLGRAGRPRYDTNGEGIIITHQANVQYYLAILNQQLPIESQLFTRLADNLNAEIVLGNVKTRDDAVDWLGYTYLYVRMLKAPVLYNAPIEADDTALIRYREDLAHSALHALSSSNLIIYDEVTGKIMFTELGRIASHFYIHHNSIAAYSNMLTEHLTQIEVLRIFSSSDEFKYIPVRQEEKFELQQLLEKAPIPVKEDSNDSLAKTNVLLQAYISRLKLEGFALNADMIYITQSAGRLLRALYEICLRKRWSRLSKILLTLTKSVERRIWQTNSPFRQFQGCPSEIIRRAEASSLPWKEYFTLTTPNEVGQALRSEKHGKQAFDLLRRFPKIELRCSMQPITPSLLKFELVMLPQWIWDSKIHGYLEPFVLFVEDPMGEKLLYSDTFSIKEDSINMENYLDFTISLSSSYQEQLPPNLFITVISERWLYCEEKVPVLLNNVRLPKKFPSATPLLDIEPLSTEELQIEEFINAMQVSSFNQFQSQIFPALYNSNENVLVGASKGCGKTIMAELALLNHWRQNGNRAVYICPSQIQIDHLSRNWSQRFSNLAGGKVINKLQGDLSQSLRILAQSHLILCTPEQFDSLSRRWKQRRNVQRIDLLIADDVHLIGNGLAGAVYENIISRMVFISAQLETNLRLVGLASSLASSRDFGEWMGVSKSNIFNFSSQERARPVTIQMKSLETGSAYSKSLLNFIIERAKLIDAKEISPIIFVPDKRRSIEIALELTQIASNQGIELSKIEHNLLENHLLRVKNNAIAEALKHGIGILYKEMPPSDRKVIEKLHRRKELAFIVVSKECTDWKLEASFVSVLGTKCYEGKEHRLIDYTINDLLEMVGSATTGNDKNEVLVISDNRKADYYKKFLIESLPVESFMYLYLHDAFSNEISTSIIESKQDCIDWITYTYFYRRIHANPTFYGVKDITPLGISSYLTDLVEAVIKDLTDSSIIEVEEVDLDNDNENEDELEESIAPLNGCLIASFYNVSFVTMQMFLSSLSKSSGLRSILETLCRASEFEVVPIREGEFQMLQALHRKLPLKVSEISISECSSFKTYVLLQAYFSRMKLTLDFDVDLKEILCISLPLVNAIVDLLAGEGHLNATTAMDISQMLVQGVWDTDSPLKQVPFFDSEIIKKCNAMKVETVYDIMSLEDSEREQILTMEGEELSLVANFVNSYPNIELTYSIDLSEPFVVNEVKIIEVHLNRDEEPETLEVISAKFPSAKKENWWLVVGEASTKELYSVKRVTPSQEMQNYEMEVNIPTSGHHKLTLWCVCDSYMDADKEVTFDVQVDEK